ncbi:GMC oxidoreductase [Segniliparus rugosus]|uniref:GMC oxidoreductase n=1 Tax=Segniliparus rugosus TaxID=286804 RepID=UPI0001F04137|nr:GMC oxidoreductase [Segniliparus rugosus]
MVDAYGSAHGLDKLRVVDASILPGTSSAASNPTVIGIAETIARETCPAEHPSAGRPGERENTEIEGYVS